MRTGADGLLTFESSVDAEIPKITEGRFDSMPFGIFVKLLADSRKNNTHDVGNPISGGSAGQFQTLNGQDVKGAHDSLDYGQGEEFVDTLLVLQVPSCQPWFLLREIRGKVQGRNVKLYLRRLSMIPNNDRKVRTTATISMLFHDLGVLVVITDNHAQSFFELVDAVGKPHRAVATKEEDLTVSID